MVKNWLICLPRKDLQHCMEIGVFGLNRKFILGRVKRGDRIVCCASKDWKIIGTGQITEEYYLDTERIFIADGVFPDRIRFDARNVEIGKEVDVIQLLDRLSFVKNLAYWAVFFRSGIVEISNDDWTHLSGKA